MTLKVIAKFAVVRYNGEIGEESVEEEINTIAISNEILMKALNSGDISTIPCPVSYGTQGYSGDLDGAFKNNSVFGKHLYMATEIVSETIWGQIRFVFKRGENRVMEWEYVNGK